MGLFSKHKDVAENKQTQEIKQATISDTQTNNIGQNPSQGEQSQTIQQNNFVNPFTNQNSAPQAQAVEQPINSNTQLGQEQTNQVMQPTVTQPKTPEQQPTQNANPFGLTTNDKTNFLEQEKQTAEGQEQTNQAAEQQLTQTSILPENNKEEQLSKDEITEMIDETVEKLIEEKWDTLVDNVNKILKWKETTESQIHMLKDDILNISEGFSKLESKLISKISNYDKDILDVNSEIKALEKVFQKITPTLINNVNELSKIADDFKGIKSKARKVEEDDDEETSKEDK